MVTIVYQIVQKMDFLITMIQILAMLAMKNVQLVKQLEMLIANHVTIIIFYSLDLLFVKMIALLDMQKKTIQTHVMFVMRLVQNA
mgnify:CR=1 FL=1